MGNLGFQEIALIFIIALIIFGPRKLPEIGKTLGKSLAEFKKATNDLKTSWEEEVRIESDKLKREVGSLDDTSTTDYTTTDYATTDHGTTDLSTTDHGTTDHGTTDHGATDHGTTDLSTTDHGATDHTTTDRSS